MAVINITKDVSMNKDFADYLKSKRLFSKYVRNVKAYDIKHCFYTSYITYMTQGFDWQFSNESENFWLKACNEHEAYLNRKGKAIYD